MVKADERVGKGGTSPIQGPQVYLVYFRSMIQCRSEISEQRRRKMNARDTRRRVFFDASKIAYRIRVCAFVIHSRNFDFSVLFAEQKNKLRDCRQVENLHTVCGFDYCQFRSANAADESIHRALFPSLIPFYMQQRSRETSEIKSANYDPKNIRHYFFQCLP